MRFQVLELAYDVIASLRSPYQAIRAADPKLAKQLRDAANSVPLNIEEADGRRGGDRAYHFRVALGSAKDDPEGDKGLVGASCGDGEVIRPVLPLTPAAFSEVEGEGGESTAELSSEVAVGFLEAEKGGAEGADGFSLLSDLRLG